MTRSERLGTTRLYFASKNENQNKRRSHQLRPGAFAGIPWSIHSTSPLRNGGERWRRVILTMIHKLKDPDPTRFNVQRSGSRIVHSMHGWLSWVCYSLVRIIDSNSYTMGHLKTHFQRSPRSVSRHTMHRAPKGLLAGPRHPRIGGSHCIAISYTRPNVTEPSVQWLVLLAG